MRKKIIYNFPNAQAAALIDDRSKKISNLNICESKSYPTDTQWTRPCRRATKKRVFKRIWSFFSAFAFNERLEIGNFFGQALSEKFHVFEWSETDSIETNNLIVTCNRSASFSCNFIFKTIFHNHKKVHGQFNAIYVLNIQTSRKYLSRQWVREIFYDLLILNAMSLN